MTRYDEHSRDSSDGDEQQATAVDDERSTNVDDDDELDETGERLDAAVDVPIVDALEQRRAVPLTDDEREHL